MFEYVGIGRWNFGRSLLDLGKLILIIVSINWYICFSFSVLRNGMWHTIMWKDCLLYTSDAADDYLTV